MKIAFYHISPINLSLEIVSQHPLGGTESALMSMAEALAKLGHEVYVFTQVKKDEDCANLHLRSYLSFEEFAIQHSLDVFICLRLILPLLFKRWAKVQVYFSPDAHDQHFLKAAIHADLNIENEKIQLSLFALNDLVSQVDAVFCVGFWQAQTFHEVYKVPYSKLFVVHNGVDSSVFFSSPLHKRKKQIVYSSTPFRGLEYLLNYFPEIKKRVPDAECAVMSGTQLYGDSDEEDRKLHGHIYQMLDQSGVKSYGLLSKPQMAKVFSESRVMGYPNTFPETFCMAALEAMSAGLVVVSSEKGAMPERINSGLEGYLVAGEPSSVDYKSKFIDAVCALLENDELFQKMQFHSIQKAALYSYDCVALIWQKILTELLTRNPAEVKFLLPSQIQFSYINQQGQKKESQLSREMMLQLSRQVLRDLGFKQVL